MSTQYKYYKQELENDTREFTSIRRTALYMARVTNIVTEITSGEPSIVRSGVAKLGEYHDVQASVYTELQKLEHFDSIKTLIDDVKYNLDHAIDSDVVIDLPTTQSKSEPVHHSAQEVDTSEVEEAHELLTTAMGDVQALAADQLAWLGQQTEALATVQSQVVALNSMMQQLSHGMMPTQQSGGADDVSYKALVLVVGKLLPNTLIKTIKQQRVNNPEIARKLIKASFKVGGDRREKVEELFHGDIPDMGNW